MKIHELKILPEYYDAVRCGDKRFEIRKNDRDFHSGDILRLKEWDEKEYTGEEIDALVRYVYYGIDEYGLSEGYCIMSIDTMMHSIPRQEGQLSEWTERGLSKGYRSSGSASPVTVTAIAGNAI